MTNDKIIKKIEEAAHRDQQKRQDIRFLRAMAFLTHKGFLKSNREYQNYFAGKIPLADLVWAGRNLEPRILEVLPAVLLRFPKSIMGSLSDYPDLQVVVHALRKKEADGPSYWKVPFKKAKIWLQLELNDQRSKSFRHKKMLKTYRFSPQTLDKLQLLKKKFGLNETEVLEKIVTDTSEE